MTRQEEIDNKIESMLKFYHGNRTLKDLLTEMAKWADSHSKTVNKVEPKFKVGDWIVQENIGVYKIIEICEFWYEVIDFEYNHYSISFDNEHMCHLWTIQDAKDGDVLVAEIDEEPNDFIYIFKEHNKNLGFWSHCYLDAYTNKFHEGIYHNNLNVGVPAIKEQRDFLFQKIKETGYKWDAGKKELRKIEQKSAWSEEDEKKRTLLISILEVNHPNGYFKVNPANTLNMEAMSTKEIVDWLKSLKERMKVE